MRSWELDWARRLRDSTCREGGDEPPAIESARYEVRERLGEGATAVVYRAWDRTLRRPVALKVLRDAAGMSDLARERFHREAQASAALSHPNLVPVYDAGEEAGRLFLVMELVEGQSLGEVLKDLPFGERRILELLEKTARGVAAAHDKGIVHRDLKPANILLTGKGEPKVSDFGLAHLVDSGAELTRTGTQLGTPLYMAPEQVQGRSKEVSPRTDVYALGTILFEALTGRPPHTGQTIHEIYDNIVQAEPPSPRSIRPAVSADVETIIGKAMDKDPARRYATAGELADDLRRFLNGEPIQARPTSGLARLWRRALKHRAVLLPTAVAVGLVLAGAIWSAGAARQNARKVRASLDRAARFEKEDDFKEALAEYRAALALDDGNAHAHAGAERASRALRHRDEEREREAKAYEEVRKRLERAPAPPENPAPAGDVVLAEDFENYNVRNRWTEYGAAPDSIAIVEGGVGGSKCLRLTSRPQFLEKGAYVYRMLPPGLETCHVRVYVKFEASEDNLINRGVQLHGNNPPTRWPQVRATDKVPRGDQTFSTCLEACDDRRQNPGPSPWRFITTWCDSTKPRGQPFRPRTPVPVPAGQWICVEMMLKCNTAPDLADGEQALWVEGKEVYRQGGFRWRTVPELVVNGLQLYNYFAYVGTPEELGKSNRTCRLWFDDVVVSKAYVGPKTP